jgi:hypothetical protein
MSLPKLYPQQYYRTAILQVLCDGGAEQDLLWSTRKDAKISITIHRLAHREVFRRAGSLGIKATRRDFLKSKLRQPETQKQSRTPRDRQQQLVAYTSRSFMFWATTSGAAQQWLQNPKRLSKSLS